CARDHYSNYDYW
nr:immunoglobulin heavy chain junction region [Mus musculus]MBK4197207.1 immunoglobulin heavy chain junction region [Mus musculus]